MDSRDFLDPKVLLVRLGSLVSRVLLVKLDLMVHLDPEVTEVSLESVGPQALPDRSEPEEPQEPLAAMELRERLVLEEHQEARDPLACRGCPASVDLPACLE